MTDGSEPQGDCQQSEDSSMADKNGIEFHQVHLFMVKLGEQALQIHSRVIAR